MFLYFLPLPISSPKGWPSFQCFAFSLGLWASLLQYALPWASSRLRRPIGVSFAPWDPLNLDGCKQGTSWLSGHPTLQWCNALYLLFRGPIWLDCRVCHDRWWVKKGHFILVSEVGVKMATLRINTDTSFKCWFTIISLISGQSYWHGFWWDLGIASYWSSLLEVCSATFRNGVFSASTSVLYLGSAYEISTPKECVFRMDIWLVVWNIFFTFPYIGNNHPIWLIFFRRVQTTNQIWDWPKTCFQSQSTCVYLRYFDNGCGWDTGVQGV